MYIQNELPSWIKRPCLKLLLLYLFHQHFLPLTRKTTSLLEEKQGNVNISPRISLSCMSSDLECYILTQNVLLSSLTLEYFAKL